MTKSNGNLKYSKAGLLCGLILAIPPLISAGIGSLLALRVMEEDIRGNIQQAIGDTSLMLAAHFREQLEDLITQTKTEGELQLNSLKVEESNATKHPMILGAIKPPFETGLVDMVPEVLDISIWRRGNPANVFDGDSAPQRRILRMNRKFPAFTLDRTNLVTAVEEAEKLLVNPAFQGSTLVALAPAILGVRKFATVAVPLSSSNGKGTVDEVAVAHISLGKIQADLPKNGLITAVLVDGFGKIMIRPLRDNQLLDTLPGLSQLLEKMKSSKYLSGQLTFTEATPSGDENYYGGYSRLGMGEIAVLASLSEFEGTAALRVLRHQLVSLWVISFLVFFMVGYRLSSFLKFGEKDKKSDAPAVDALPLLPQKSEVILLYGSLHNFNHLLALETPETLTEGINDYLNLILSTAKGYGGIFVRSTGGDSFVISWGAPENEGTEGWRALRCALQLRIEFKNFNNHRKVNGQRPLFFGMGIHVGTALVASIGTLDQASYAVLGDVLDCARTLGRLSANGGRDLLVSHEVWSQSDAKFAGAAAGEAKLSQESGLTQYYSLSGYRNEQGEEVDVSPPIHETEGAAPTSEVFNQEKKTHRWLINNGTQMVGPFTAEEIAPLLFAQELDFDSECWSEGLGVSGQINSSGIFTGSQEVDANLWLYDGKTVHGPVSPGFLRTAIGHGAMPKTVHICENSTVNGWLTLEAWDQALFGKAV